jgi:hypothetical protein
VFQADAERRKARKMPTREKKKKYKDSSFLKNLIILLRFSTGKEAHTRARRVASGIAFCAYNVWKGKSFGNLT